jgi:hypothetical protein
MAGLPSLKDMWSRVKEAAIAATPDPYEAGGVMAQQLRKGDILGGLNTLVSSGMPMPGMFIGPQAATWSPFNANVAQRMERNQRTPQEVNALTGTHRGPGGHQWQEIPDNKADYMLRRVTEEPIPLNQAMHHPQLFEAYPDLANVPVRSTAYGQTRYAPDKDMIYLANDLRDMPRTGSGALLHEVQHAIQMRERWPGGANPTQFEPGASLSQHVRPREDPLATYRRVAGEQQAEATRLRQGLSEGERRLFQPGDYMIPNESQIVIYPQRGLPTR